MRVLALTMLDDEASLRAAMEAGAAGYLVKGARPEDVIRAVLSVAAGELVFGASVADRVLRHLSAPRPPALPNSPTGSARCSP
ncbi:response regulator transcription factor [Jiangella asiatica]|uniref:Response regulator transcription factor n=1 Tax=Jiangella asiatica TaxID=2530372 RepID=A0A4R5CKT2_9ACTN|nr:response regulator transcription factor [Jiangella asiatica]TDE00922.1 response regulator transcription factor [Jiangella asiatica]